MLEKEAKRQSLQHGNLDNQNRNQAAQILSEKSLDKKLLMKSIQKEFGKDGSQKDMKNLQYLLYLKKYDKQKQSMFEENYEAQILKPRTK